MKLVGAIFICIAIQAETLILLYTIVPEIVFAFLSFLLLVEGTLGGAFNQSSSSSSSSENSGSYLLTGLERPLKCVHNKMI